VGSEFDVCRPDEECDPKHSWHQRNGGHTPVSLGPMRLTLLIIPKSSEPGEVVLSVQRRIVAHLRFRSSHLCKTSRRRQFGDSKVSMTKRIPISIPPGRFTSADLAAEYPTFSRFVYYQRIHEWLADGKIKLVGTTAGYKQGGKGKNVYEPQTL
jgi:hypothetical protein